MAEAQVVLPCDDLDAAVDWFEGRGFQLRTIAPADRPRVAVIEGHGLVVCLDRRFRGEPGWVKVVVDELPEPAVVVAPNGTTVEYVARTLPQELPVNVPEFAVVRPDAAEFRMGRAGMRYRDLIPGRQGGRYIASHISIPDGGPVPDYVHHHDVRVQLIFCHAGWADLVYEDQGPPFRMEAGDCVLQPPHIRHRVLETSDRFEVVEFASPAEHPTIRDHRLDLPTDTVDPDREFGGQRFVHHRAAEAIWAHWDHRGFDHADFGLGAATGNVMTAALVRPTAAVAIDSFSVTEELRFWYVRSGRAVLSRGRDAHDLEPGVAVTFDAGETYALAKVSDGFELLELRVP